MKAYYETCICGEQVWPQPSGRWVCDACGRDHGLLDDEDAEDVAALGRIHAWVKRRRNRGQLCSERAKGNCAASVDGYCIGGYGDPPRCHG